MIKNNHVDEIKFIFDQISLQIKIQYLPNAIWKIIIIKKIFRKIKHFYFDNESRFYEFEFVRKILLKTLLIIKDSEIKPITAITNPSKTIRNEYFGLVTYKTNKIIDFKNYHLRNQLLKFFNNSSIIKI
tara:strand:+ start:313 stop:699 length:387 start_codon:yes stop_codon:yes gene_type:complete